MLKVKMSISKSARGCERIQKAAKGSDSLKSPIKTVAFPTRKDRISGFGFFFQNRNPNMKSGP